MKYFEFRINPYERYPEDCQKIWDYLNDIGKPNFSRSSLESLWEDFSDIKYDAGFLGPDADNMEEFARWLSEKTI